MHLRALTAISLSLLAAAGIYCLFVLGFNGGLFKVIGDLKFQENPKFPGSENALVVKYTGIEALDKHLGLNLVPFFSPIVQGNSNQLNLYSVFMLGQFGAGWTLLQMESLRKGNKGRAVSFVGIYGLLVQNAGFATATPLYLLLHVLTSPVADLSPSTQGSGILQVSSYDLAILPFSLILGYILPSLLCLIPSPSVVSSDTQQTMLAIWQAFPLYAVIIQWVLRNLCLAFVSQPTTSSAVKKSRGSALTSYISSAGKVYKFVLALSMVTHIPVLLITLLPPAAFQKLSPLLASLARSSFSDVFVPPPPVLSHRMLDMADGVHTFLKWDCYIAGLAALLWASVLVKNVSVGKQEGSLAFKIVLWTLLSGPFGALAILLWERDAILSRNLKKAE